jgi:dTDP-4-dehydrorhamnose reductase
MAVPSRVLLIAPDGMLGRAWATLLDERGIEHETLRYPAFDLSDRGAVDELDLTRADVVVNCSGWTDVDGAQEHEAAATVVNGEGVGWLAQRCGQAGRMLVHYGTDYVFDGKGTRPYAVDAPQAPINAYGRSKQVGEARIAASKCRHLVVRTSWLYAPWGQNFVRTMARLGRERDRLRVVDDQRGRPTSAEHLARTSLALLEHDAAGTFHVTDGGECSWFELARRVVRAIDPSCVVEPCTSDEFVRPAARPAYSVLDLSKTEKTLGPMPHWHDNLSAVLERLEP